MDEVILVFMGPIMGTDMDCPPVVMPTAVVQAANLLDVLWALLYAPWEALVPFGPAVKREQDQYSSEFISVRLDTPLRQHI